jgi:hypothetical protein
VSDWKAKYVFGKSSRITKDEFSDFCATQWPFF